MKSRCLFALFLLSIFNVSTIVAQIDTDRIPPAQDTGNLYLRATASRFVVLATVGSVHGVGLRMTPELLRRVKTEGDLSLVLGGSLYTIHVESTICRQTDFKADERNSSDAPKTMYMFLPRDEPMFVNGHQREILLSGQRYLLFLSEAAPEVQQKWVQSLQLDPKQDYYRVEGLSRGVVPLFRQIGGDFTPMQPHVLELVTELCRAVRPPNVNEKLAALKRLGMSGDPILQREAEAAAKALQAGLSH